MLHIVDPVFPAVSDVGAEPPASCVFGILLSIGAVFGVVIMYIRHSYIEKKSLDNSYKIHVLNDVTFLLGVISCIGIMMVASFQWTKRGAHLPHIIGAFLVFVLGNVHCWCQSYLTYLTEQRLNRILKVRVGMNVCSATAFCLFVTFRNFAAKLEAGVKDVMHWKSSEAGYSLHLGGMFSEWIMVISFLLYFSTFYGEFRNVECQVHANVKNGNGNAEDVCCS